MESGNFSIHKLIEVLCRTEEEIGVDNLKLVEVPEEVSQGWIGKELNET
jgi:hypothetical protein